MTSVVNTAIMASWVTISGPASTASALASANVGQA
jgi:hypothetical protein